MWLWSEEPSRGARGRGRSGTARGQRGAPGAAWPHCRWRRGCARPVGGALPACAPRAAGCEAGPEVGGRGGGERVGGEGRQGQRRVRQGLLGKFAAGGAPARALRAAAGHPVALVGQLGAVGTLAHSAGHEGRAGRPSSRKSRPSCPLTMSHCCPGALEEWAVRRVVDDVISCLLRVFSCFLGPAWP